MQDQPNEAGDPPTASQDLKDQGVALIHVLQHHPMLLTIPDLVREITNGSKDFAEGDNVERALRDLTGVGLLHCPKASSSRPQRHCASSRSCTRAYDKAALERRLPSGHA
jgi:hypothetical protein